MNWRAHILLAGPDPEHQLGGVLADLVPMSVTRTLPAGLRRGIALHHAIDGFSDAQPAVCASNRRISTAGVGLRPAAAAIAVDMLYDHLLARGWERRYPGIGLATFAENFHALAATHAATVPPKACEVLGYMAAQDWLGCYAKIGEIRTALERIRLRLSPRAQASCPLASAVEVFTREPEASEADFERFWPDVTAHAGRFLAQESSLAAHV